MNSQNITTMFRRLSIFRTTNHKPIQEQKTVSASDKIDQAKLYARIKALLAKTAEANCTEAEAQLASDKARELIAKYQIDLTEF